MRARNVTDFLLLAGDSVHEKSEITGFHLCGQSYQSAAGIHDHRGSLFVECALRVAPTVNQHRHVQGPALAGTKVWFLGARRGGFRCLRFGGKLRVFRRCLHGKLALDAVSFAFKVPGRAENLLEGFVAVLEDDPALVVAVRTAQPDSVVLGH